MEYWRFIGESIVSLRGNILDGNFLTIYSGRREFSNNLLQKNGIFQQFILEEGNSLKITLEEGTSSTIYSKKGEFF